MAQNGDSDGAPADNDELFAIFLADQRDREGNLATVDGTAVFERDRRRRARVEQILAAEGARSARDFYRAAMVFQHGEELDHFRRAHDLALRAIELDPTLNDARWLAAAATDRELVRLGRPQRFGTQYRIEQGRWIHEEVNPLTTDEERAAWNVPPVAELRARVRRMNEPG